MPIKIHHGAPGSYKTSGVVNEDLVRWMIDGRTVVTNVRGLEETKAVANAYNKNKKSKAPVASIEFQLIFLETETREGKEKMARWFQWAPLGCAFLIDEIQTIYPQKWTAADYKKVSYETEADAIEAGNRPMDVYIAFEKHRHYNWDFVVTAPSIKKVPAIVRDVAEMGYYHSNRKKIGLGGYYLEAMHNPDDAGNKKAQWLLHEIKKAPRLAFKMYQSTETGSVTDTFAGRNIFLQPRVIGFAVVFLLACGVLISRGNPLNLGKVEFDDQGELKNDVSQAGNVVVASTDVVRAGQGVPVVTQTVVNSARVAGAPTPDPFADLLAMDLYVGGISGERFIYINVKKTLVDVSMKSIERFGYKVVEIDRCVWLLTRGDASKFIYCPDQANERDTIVGRVSDHF